MANAYTTNFTLHAAGETFSAIWALTRAQIAAGWRYKAMGNGQASGTKDTTANFANDRWGFGGLVHGSSAGRVNNTGAGVAIGAASATTGLSVVTGVTGATAASVGDYLVVTGSGSGNNGNYQITAQTGTSVTVYGPNLVAETGNAGLTAVEQFGGADGSLTTYTTVTAPGKSPLINFTTSVFAGFVSTDVGKQITIISSGSGNTGTYTIAQFVSSSNVLLYSPPNSTDTAPFITASDTGNPTLQWVCFDPLQQGYPTYISAANGSGAWWCAQGPSILKIAIGTNVQSAGSSGYFLIRGENVIQSSTGAQGELLGYVPDSSGGTGYLVIAPRVYGNGGGVRGWNNSGTDTITGALSGATVTSTSTAPIDYIHEVLFWKNVAATGHVYSQCIDQNPATESATTATTGRFSTLAASGTVTAQLCPGGSTGGNPTTNGFPTVGTYTVIGTGGSGVAATGPAQWSGAESPTAPGKAQILVANCIEYLNVSADGTWGYYQSCNSIGYQGLSFQRLDNQEDGDLDPYIHQAHWSGTQNLAPNRTADTLGTGSATDNMNTSQTWISSSTSGHGFKGFRRRGLSGETFNYFAAAALFDVGDNVFVLKTNVGNPDQVSTAASTTYVREPLWVYLTPFTAQLAAGRMRKGTLRWLQMVQGPAVNSTFDNLEWIVLSTTAASFAAGPYDGVTTPSF